MLSRHVASATAAAAAIAPRTNHARRTLRTTAPREVGPLIAGIGIAAVAYGTKLLVSFFGLALLVGAFELRTHDGAGKPFPAEGPPARWGS